MKCIIATYYQYNNYGTKLQNYALIKTLEKYNIETYTLYPYNSKEIISEKIKDFLSLFPITNKQKIWKNNFKKKVIFRKLNKELNFKKIRYSQIKKEKFIDYFGISGSDQIWSPKYLKYNKNDINIMFLDFINPKYRFAYAPSFGVSQIDQDMVEIYKDRLKNFKKISVREEKGAEIVKSIANIDVPVIPDPVFLISKEEWKKNIGKRIIEEKYIVTYFLSRRSFEEREEIKKFAQNNKLKIVDIMGNYYEKESILVEPLDFLNIISYAEFVFTDSFHATVFSLIMEKNFTVYERIDVKQFSRISNLLTKFNCIEFVKNDCIEEIRNHKITQKQIEILNEMNKLSNIYLKEIIKEVE